MARFNSKFENQLPVLQQAATGEVDLRSDRKLYKKLYKFYKDQGVIFSGDSDLDYEVVVNCLYGDIFEPVEV